MGWLGNLIKGGVKLIPGVGNVAGAVFDGVDAMKGAAQAAKGGGGGGGGVDIGKILAAAGIGAAGINDLISGHTASSKRNQQLDAAQAIGLQNAQAGQDLYNTGAPIRQAASSAILQRIRAGAGAPIDVSGLASRRNPMRANYATPAMRAPLGAPAYAPNGGTLANGQPLPAKQPRSALATAAAALMARR